MSMFKSFMISLCTFVTFRGFFTNTRQIYLVKINGACKGKQCVKFPLSSYCNLVMGALIDFGKETLLTKECLQ